MTPNKGELRCRHCWRLEGDSGHKPWCPLNLFPDNPRKVAEWERGYNRGFSGDERLGWNRLRNYSDPFIAGYRTGNAEMEGLIDGLIANR